ncbi:hypothetical protein BLNAU_5317 [Blattamonas nauphoetae]|uniref:Uncharacterized protein n=1 Tax=Blattamonas nauphoetae TaxID=2049346 RepID=A0ABQ9Y807_9EUKA|nr:hypothetical protein BLNAU_5317 [Blattamonas nauphoetae]
MTFKPRGIQIRSGTDNSQHSVNLPIDQTLSEPFFDFDPNSELSFKQRSIVYCSLVVLVKQGYPFDNALLDRAARFLWSLESMWEDQLFGGEPVLHLVPSSDGSPSDFVESLFTLLSSPHLAIVQPAILYLYNTIFEYTTPAFQLRFVESNLVTKVLATVQHHTLPLSGNTEILMKLVWILTQCLQLAFPSSLEELKIISAVDQYNHREMIFQKALLPSSQFLTFLISNRNSLDGQLLHDFMSLLSTLLEISPFHRPMMEFVLASPIAMAFSSSLLFDEEELYLSTNLLTFNNSLKEWKIGGPEIAQSVKRMIQALFSEGFEDTLEQMMMHNKGENYGANIIFSSHSISNSLGSNAKRL